MTTNTALPTFTTRYMDMTADELRTAYAAWRNASYTWSQMACMAAGKSSHGRRIAGGWGRCIRECEFIENVARKRNIRLG